MMIVIVVGTMTGDQEHQLGERTVVDVTAVVNVTGNETMIVTVIEIVAMDGIRVASGLR